VNSVFPPSCRLDRVATNPAASLSRPAFDAGRARHRCACGDVRAQRETKGLDDVIRVSKARDGAGTIVTFALPDDVGPVSVVGDFNDWTPGVHVLQRRSNGTRSVAVNLGAGRFEFRYLAADGLWLDEPAAPERSGPNAVLAIAAA
jgi:hypothetical protein